MTIVYQRRVVNPNRRDGGGVVQGGHGGKLLWSPSINVSQVALTRLYSF